MRGAHPKKGSTLLFLKGDYERKKILKLTHDIHPSFRKPQNRCEHIAAKLSLSKVTYSKMSVFKTLDPSQGFSTMFAFVAYLLFLNPLM